MTHIRFTIRDAQRGDIEELARLCAAHADYERAAVTPVSKPRLAALLFDSAPRLHCLVVQRSEAHAYPLAGYATWSEEVSTWSAGCYAHMDCLYLDDDARGQGLGRALVKLIANRAAAQGLRQLQWQTPAFNTDAIRFYERLDAVGKHKLRFCLDIE